MTDMRIGLFAVMAGRNAGGPEVYEYNLVRSLAEIDRTTEYHVFCLDQKAADSFGISQENFIFHVLRPHSRWISITTDLPLKMFRNGLDFLHSCFTPPLFIPRRHVFTHHCFSNFAHPEFYDPLVLWRLNRLIIKGLKKSRAVVCVSENVRTLTAEKFKLPLEKMFVVHNGVNAQFAPMAPDLVRPALAAKYAIDFPYALYAGKLQSRKNIVRILESFAIVRREVRPDLKLVLAGRRTWKSEGLDEALDRLRLRDHVLELGYMRNEDLPLLYNGAEVFLFPSLWEGFGIPVVEAMACGTPVVTSNLSSLPEIAGDAALLVDPYSVDAIAGAMERLLTDEPLRRELREKGLRRAADFSWRETALRTRQVYARLADV